MKTSEVKIGKIKIGAGLPIAIQSMTNTPTADAIATANQIVELYNAGSEIVRFTVDTEDAAVAVPKIKEILIKKGYGNIPLVGDFHFNGHILLEKYPEMAKILDKYRINPGNIGYGKLHDENYAKIIKIAIKNKKPIRIGANSGSLDQELLQKLFSKSKKSEKEVMIDAIVKSALDSANFAEKLGMKRNEIVISVKMSDVVDTIKAYEKLADEMKKQKRIYAVHLGLTEAGSGTKGIIKSTTAMAVLLNEGIGDTIRVSLTPSGKKGSRNEEVQVCKDILQSLSLRSFGPEITSCPGCGRTNNKLFQKIVSEVNSYLESSASKKLKNIKIAIMGCVVNGPGEAKTADIALMLPGKTEKEIAQVYVKGKLYTTLQGKNISKQFWNILQNI